MSTSEAARRSGKLLVGPILCRIWRLQNARYKVAACLHLLHLEANQVAIVTAGRLMSMLKPI